jgi:ADP-ribosylglycohydrolase
MHESSSSILCSMQQECVPTVSLDYEMTHYHSRGKIASVITSTVTNLLITQQLASEKMSSPAVSRRHQTNVVCLRRNSLHSAERLNTRKEKNVDSTRIEKIQKRMRWSRDERKRSSSSTITSTDLLDGWFRSGPVGSPLLPSRSQSGGV